MLYLFGVDMTNLMTRRDALRLALAGAGVALPGWAEVGPANLGANTAIDGMGLLEAIALLRDLGFPVIEIQAMGTLAPRAGAFPGFEYDRLTPDEKRAIRRALEGFRRVTIHLPYAGLHYFDASAAGAAASLERLRYAMDSASYFGCKLAVIHTTTPVGLTTAEAWPRMVESFRQWGDAAAKGGFQLAIETGTGAIDSAREFVRLVREVDHAIVGCTLDVGHQSGYREFAHVAKEDRATPAGIQAYNDLMHEIIDGLGSKLFHFHVHDIDPKSWKEHVPVGTNIIDYGRLIAKLRRTGYSGSFVLEIASPDMRASLADSKRRMEAFLRA